MGSFERRKMFWFFYCRFLLYWSAQVETLLSMALLYWLINMDQIMFSVLFKENAWIIWIEQQLAIVFEYYLAFLLFFWLKFYEARPESKRNQINRVEIRHSVFFHFFYRNFSSTSNTLKWLEVVLLDSMRKSSSYRSKFCKFLPKQIL